MTKTRDEVLEEFGIPVSERRECEGMADEIVRLRNIVATYGKIELTWPEKQYVTAVYTHVPTPVLLASDNPRELFTEALKEGMQQIIDEVEQRRRLSVKEDT